MNIRRLGEVRPHPDVPEWLLSAPIPVPFFDGLPLTFTLDGLEEQDASEVATAIESFLQLGPADRLAASPHVYQNWFCEPQRSPTKRTSPAGSSSDFEVWEHVHPSEVFVSRRSRRDRGIYIQITAECDWEPEHGLQLVFRRGCELSRVSDQDGHLTHTDAFDLPEEQDKIA